MNAVMKAIVGSRGSGKTFQLVKAANEAAEQGHRVIVLVATKNQIDVTLKAYGLRDDVETIPVNTYIRNRSKGVDYEDAVLFIDEFEYVLPRLLGARVVSVTIGSENIEFIDRQQ